MGIDKVEKNRERILKLIEMISEPRRSKVKEMLDGPLGLEFFTAPASTRVSYHSCYPGGLAQHSLNVVKYLVELAETLTPGTYSKEKLVFVGLFHDLGKAGDGEVGYYRQNPSEWHREKLGQHYEINPECLAMPNSERGLYVLQKFGIEVDHDEYLSIRLNDGQYDDTNKAYRMKEPDLAILVHYADLWATRQEKSSEE